MVLLNAVTAQLPLHPIWVMDGFQFAAQVQKLYPHIKLQMVSGFDGDRYGAQADKTLHQNMLRKPYLPRSLLEHVRNHLDK